MGKKGNDQAKGPAGLQSASFMKNAPVFVSAVITPVYALLHHPMPHQGAAPNEQSPAFGGNGCHMQGSV